MAYGVFYTMPKDKNNWISKIKRFFTALLMPVSKKRQGNCSGCGACCRLPVKCLFLKAKGDGTYYCTIYKFRPPPCRKYPRIRSEWITEDTCTYKFIDSE